MSQDLLEKIRKTEQEAEEAVLSAEKEGKQQISLKERERIEILQNLEKSLDSEINEVYHLAEKKLEEMKKKEEEKRRGEIERLEKVEKIKKSEAIKFILENLENLIKL